MIPEGLASELLEDFRVIGQAQERAVTAQEPMPAPEPPVFFLLGGVKTRQHHFLVEFDQRGVGKLGARLGPAARGCGAGAPQPHPVKESVQVPLHRFGGFLQEKKHDNRKGQNALASKVLCAAPVARAEVRGEQTHLEMFNHMQPAMWRGGDCVVHPHGKTILSIQCMGLPRKNGQ
jgi:hypothetical protein